jgi:hypothetical protein
VPQEEDDRLGTMAPERTLERTHRGSFNRHRPARRSPGTPLDRATRYLSSEGEVKAKAGGDRWPGVGDQRGAEVGVPGKGTGDLLAPDRSI